MEQNLQNFLTLTRELMKKFHIINRDQQYCHNVTLSQGYAIKILAQKGKASMTELSQDLGVAPSTTTRIIDVLVRDNIVQRDTECDDRRQVCVKLTDKGLNLHEEIEASSTRYLSLFLKSLPEAKQDNVIEALTLLNKAIGDIFTNNGDRPTGASEHGPGVGKPDSGTN